MAAREPRLTQLLASLGRAPPPCEEKICASKNDKMRAMFAAVGQPKSAPAATAATSAECPPDREELGRHTWTLVRCAPDGSRQARIAVTCAPSRARSSTPPPPTTQRRPRRRSRPWLSSSFARSASSTRALTAPRTFGARWRPRHHGVLPLRLLRRPPAPMIIPHRRWQAGLARGILPVDVRAAQRREREAREAGVRVRR